MVTFEGESPRKNRKYTRKPKDKEVMRIKIMAYTITGVLIFIAVNALIWYAMNPVTTYTNVNQDDKIVFADVKPTPLLTELSNMNNDTKQATIEFSASNVNATYKVKNFECSIDAGTWTVCSSPVKLNLEEYSDDSEHTLEIRAIDNHNGTESQPLAVLFK